MPSWSSLPPLARVAWLIGLALALVFVGASVWLFSSELKTGRRLRSRGRSFPAAFPLRRIAMITTPPLIWSELLRFSWPGGLGEPALWGAVAGADYVQLGMWLLGAVLLPISIYFSIWTWARSSGEGEDPALLAEQFVVYDEDALSVLTGDDELSREARAQDQRFRFYEHMSKGEGGVPLELGELLRPPAPELPVDPKTGLLADAPPPGSSGTAPMDEETSEGFSVLTSLGALLACVLLFEFWPGLLLGALIALAYGLWAWIEQL